MDSLKLLYTEVHSFLISADLLNHYLFFLGLMAVVIILDRARLSKSIVIKGFIYKLLALIILFFFVFLYIDLFQAVNVEVIKYRSGLSSKEIYIYEKTSDYFKHTIGNSYTAGIIALLSGIFASFIKLQFSFIEKGYFCEKRNNGSLFINFIIILNVFSILTFIDHLKYSEFKVSEGMVMHIDNPSYFFSLLLITSIVVFFMTLFWHKESIFNELIKQKETK